MIPTTLLAWVDQHCEDDGERIWLRDRNGDDFVEWSWRDARTEYHAVASWLGQRGGGQAQNIAILSCNRAHWVLADLAITASGNVSIPLFTTLARSDVEYILEFTETQVLVLGEAENWPVVREILPEAVEIITMPGVFIEEPHTRWEDLVSEYRGRQPEFRCDHSDLISIVFTSGTTGVPKGVMQTHDSLLVPMQRVVPFFNIRENPSLFSYLPLSHIAERQLVMVQSLLYKGCITFNESLEHLLRDMADTRPNFFFGAPRVWEQLQQGILAKIGSQKALDQALRTSGDEIGAQIRASLGLANADYLLTAAAPTPPALIHWYEKLGLTLMEGYGQTEVMAIAANSASERKVGSIGRAPDDVRIKLSQQGELLVKAEGSAIGYYKMPEKTAETFADGWIHTGDKGYIDDDGFIFLTGRVKDYFKTIHGKYVAPVPVESHFAETESTEQVCLLGRGYPKTVMIAVVSARRLEKHRQKIEAALVQQADKVNASIEKHARIGAVIVSTEPWTIDNEVLTPTLKIRREKVEEQFGERAYALAQQAAQKGEILLEWL